MKKVGMIQSNYIPWKGYFDFINMVDVFVLYDHVQYTKKDWRNRNKIKVPGGTIWLSIPIHTKGLYPHAAINEMKVSNQEWRKKHWKSLEFYYKKAPFFEKYADVFYKLYMEDDEEYLSQINYKFIKTINQILGIETELRWSTEFKIFGNDKNEVIINILKQLDTDIYLLGPAAKSYLDEELFAREGIKVEWMDYSGYPEYPQLYTPPFVHEVSILDLIFNTGPDAPKYMKSFKK